MFDKKLNLFIVNSQNQYNDYIIINKEMYNITIIISKLKDGLYRTKKIGIKEIRN